MIKKKYKQRKNISSCTWIIFKLPLDVRNLFVEMYFTKKKVRISVHFLKNGTRGPSGLVSFIFQVWTATLSFFYTVCPVVEANTFAKARHYDTVS